MFVVAVYSFDSQSHSMFNIIRYHTKKLQKQLESVVIIFVTSLFDYAFNDVAK